MQTMPLLSTERRSMEPTWLFTTTSYISNINLTPFRRSTEVVEGIANAIQHASANEGGSQIQKER